jgi:hypothetical protein
MMGFPVVAMSSTEQHSDENQYLMDNDFSVRGHQIASSIPIHLRPHASSQVGIQPSFQGHSAQRPSSSDRELEHNTTTISGLRGIIRKAHA